MNIVQSVETRTAQFHASETAEHRYQCSLSLYAKGPGFMGWGIEPRTIENRIESEFVAQPTRAVLEPRASIPPRSRAHKLYFALEDTKRRALLNNATERPMRATESRLQLRLTRMVPP
jgi:hypothetical protein